MYVIKRNGRQERVQFDKITSRINKLAYGLNTQFVDPGAPPRCCPASRRPEFGFPLPQSSSLFLSWNAVRPNLPNLLTHSS